MQNETKSMHRKRVGDFAKLGELPIGCRVGVGLIDYFA
jgi:hypothetical protein